MATDTFAEWLEAQMQERDWKQADLARATGLNSSYLSRILNMERRIGPEAAAAIAAALTLPPDIVFEKAGLLPQKHRSTATREVSHLFNQLSDEDQDTVLIMMRALVRDKLRPHAANTVKTSPSES